VECLWAHIKRSLANLATRTLIELETLLRRRLKALQYRHGILSGRNRPTGRHVLQFGQRSTGGATA
jgi:hypothetical protein